MRSQSGLTMVEMLVSVTIISLVASMAVMSGVAMIRSAQMSQEVSRLLDQITLARMNAIGKSEDWRIRFNVPWEGDPVTGASQTTLVDGIYTVVVHSFSVESLPPGNAVWIPNGTYSLEGGLVFRVPSSSEGVPQTLPFGPAGFFNGSTTELSVCRPQTVDGVEGCQEGEVGRTIRILSPTGVIEY